MLRLFFGEEYLRAQTVDVRESAGRVLCNTIFRSGGRKLLAKGHVLSAKDVRLLVMEGLGQVWVTELEDGEVPEDEAVGSVAAEMGRRAGNSPCRGRPGQPVRHRLLRPGGRRVVAPDQLHASVVIATNPNFSFARGGQRVATVKSAPFAVGSHSSRRWSRFCANAGRFSRRARSGLRA